MHQDVFSRDFCGKGLPSWVAQNLVNASHALTAFPAPAHDPVTDMDSDGNPTEEECLENDFVSYYFSDSASNSFQGV